MLAWPDDDPKIRFLRIVYVERDEAYTRNFAHRNKSCDFILVCLRWNDQMGSMTEEAIRARLSKSGDQIESVSFYFCRDYLRRTLDNVAPA